MTRVLRQSVKWFYLLIATALILLAVMVQSGRSFSHLVGDYQQAIAGYLSHKLNAQVSFGGLSADWDGLKPSVKVRDLLIKNQAQQPIVALQKARLRLDILGSVINRRLVWSELILTDVQMAFVQTPEGFWHVHGLPKQTTVVVDPQTTDAAKKTRANLDALVDMLLLSSHIEFRRSHLNFQFASGELITLDSPSVLLENAKQFHRLSLQVDVDEQPRSVYLVMEGQGDPRDSVHFRSRGYLQLNRFPTSEPIAAASAFLLNGVHKSTLTSNGTVDANIWFESRDSGEGYDLSGNLGLQTLHLPFADRSITLDGFSTDLIGYWLPTGSWRLALQNMAANLGDQQLKDVNIAVASAGFQQTLKVTADKIDVARLTQLLNGAGALGNGKLQEVLLTLNPRGHLRHIEWTLPPSDPKNWQLRANADQLEVDAWRGVPALTGVDGYIQAGQRGGFININSQQHFSMHYSPTYAAPMAYDSAKGQVAWHLLPEQNQVYINSGSLEFRKENEYLKGYMWLALPWHANTGDIDLYLQIGAKQLNASLYSKYTPTVVPASLLTWLEQSVGDHNSGTVSTAGLVYRGTLNTKNSMARTHQLYLDVQNAALNYHPGWPSLTQVSGRLLVKDATVLASIDSAKAYDSRVEYAEVESNPRSDAPGSLLKITGSIQGPASDGIRVLRESVLRQYIGSNMDSWFLIGDMHAGLDLAIPIGTGEEKPQGAYQQVNIDLKAPSFELQNLNLQLSDVAGRIRYDSNTGIASDNLTAVLFDQPITAQMHTKKLADYSKTLIDVQGAVDTHTLAFWSQRPEALFLTGTMPYRAAIELNHRPRQESPPLSDPQRNLDQSAAEFAEQAFASVRIDSDLQGVAVTLPEPYGKVAEGERPFAFTLWLQEQQSQVDLTYNGNVQALLRMSRGKNTRLLATNIALASEATLSHQPQFLVSGYLPSFDIDAWKAVKTRYDAYTEQLTPVVVRPAAQATAKPQSAEDVNALLATDEAYDEGSTVAGLPFKAELTLGCYDVGSVKFEDVQVEVTRTASAWQLGIENPMVSGSLIVPNSAFTPLQINLQKLYLSDAALGNANASNVATSESPTTTEPPVPPTKLIDPRSLPLANVVIDELFLDGSNYGNWSLQIRPNKKGVVIDNIRGRIRGLTVSGAKDSLDGAKLIWQHTDQGTQTRFIGSFSAKDIGDVLRQWEKPDTIESSAAFFSADLFWAGSPQDLKIVELNGDMTMWMENGRFKRGVSAEDGLLRLMSLLNFDTLARRLRLDFSDLYKSGLAYDEINGKVRFNRGTLVFTEPLVVRTPSSGMQMAGTIDLRREKIDTRLVATLPVASNLTFFAALATGLPAAAGIYLVSKFFKKQVDQATSMSYSIKGSWDKPKMRFDRLFESEESLRDSVKKPSKQ